MIRFYLNLLFCRLNASSLSCFSPHLCFRPFTSFSALLWTCSSTSVSCLVMRNLELNTVLKVQPHQHQVQGEDCFPSLAGHTISDTDKDAVGLCGHLCSQTSVRDYKLLRFGNFLNYTRNINFQSSPVLHLQHFGQEVCFGMLTPGDPLLTTQQRLQEQIILLKMKK